MEKVPVTYIPGFIKDPVEALNELKTLDFVRRDGSPRDEYYVNDVPVPYTYGRGRGVRTYEPQVWTDRIRSVQAALKAFTGYDFEVCFLNRYLDQSDQLGWHADDSPEMDDKRPIAIVSLGVAREIWFRPNPTPTNKSPEVTKLVLESGSLALMAPGMQDTYQHRIPKASFKCGERISMTFRGYVK